MSQVVNSRCSFSILAASLGPGDEPEQAVASRNCLGAGRKFRLVSQPLHDWKLSASP
jgi:hypothetical protein